MMISQVVKIEIQIIYISNHHDVDWKAKKKCITFLIWNFEVKLLLKK